MGPDCRIFIPEVNPAKDRLTREEVSAIKEKAAVASAVRRRNAPGGMVEAMLCNPRVIFLLADYCLDLYDRQPIHIKYPGQVLNRSRGTGNSVNDV